MLFDLKDYFRSNKFTSDFYMLFRNYRHKSKITAYSADVVDPVADACKEYRLNLVVPCFNKSAVYGGISTALIFFNELAKLLNAQRKIIVTGNDKYSSLTYQMEGIFHNVEENGIFFLSESKSIKIRANDLFLFTSWKTAYYFYVVFDWQRQYFKLSNRRVIYLIQDFEPGFEPWSTEYVLSESTYHRSKETIAVFNSEELYNYFKLNGYQFSTEIYFKPTLNAILKKYLMNIKHYPKREKKIIVYGRPVNSRNAFSLIYSALKKWSLEYEDSKNWKIYSLGDKFINIKLENNIIVFMGKLSLEEYAKVMMTSYAGIALMVSPHPSYPPLEMSAFGVKTITNNFANKDLSTFNDNVYSLKNYTPEEICKKLTEICNEFALHPTTLVQDGGYIKGNDFQKAIINTANKVKADEAI